LQHNATSSKDKDKNVLAAPNYLFCTQLNLLFLWTDTTLYKQQVFNLRQYLELICDYIEVLVHFAFNHISSLEEITFCLSFCLENGGTTFYSTRAF
jgi:hypothetical protein